MARLKKLTILFLFLFQAATCWGQVDFGAVCTPVQRAAAVRASLASAKPGNTVNVPAGIYDFSDAVLLFPDGVAVKGDPRGGTLFQSSQIFLAKQACAFDLGNNSVVTDLTLESTCQPNQQSCVVGFGIDSEKPKKATLQRCKLVGRSWAWYSWTAPDGHYGVLEDCDITSGRVGVAGGRSSGANAQYIDLVRCRFFGDQSLSTQGGAVSHPVWGGTFGALMRGGRMRVTDCSFDLKGSDKLPRCVAITDSLDESTSSSVVIEVNGIRTKLAGNGAKEVFDVDVRKAVLKIGGSGIGEKGTLLVRKPAPTP